VITIRCVFTWFSFYRFIFWQKKSRKIHLLQCWWKAHKRRSDTMKENLLLSSNSVFYQHLFIQRRSVSCSRRAYQVWWMIWFIFIHINLKEINKGVRRNVALRSLAKYPKEQKSGACERLIQVLSRPESQQRSFLALRRDSELFLVCLPGVCCEGESRRAKGALGEWYSRAKGTTARKGYKLRGK